MEQSPKWNFPDNRYGRVFGFNTSDMETFKKDPIAHFAREICQNSIDAHRRDTTDPVRIEFKTFIISNTQVPGLSDLKQEINACRNYSATKNREEEEKISNELLESIKGVGGSIITCLRVSDFNTTGLYGVEKFDITKPFYALTRGSGSSDKGDGSAGSKGIGKYAAFVISKTNTVFYSTHAKNPETNQDEEAFFGISKLCSRPLRDDGLFTMGEGFYGCGEQNNPIMQQNSIDPNFHRTDYGTDLFIIGFNGKRDWKNEVLKKVLDSFIAAIINNSLEVSIDGQELNRTTLPQYIDKIRHQSKLSSTEKNIIAQFDILANKNDVSIHEKTVKILGDDVTFYAKIYSKQESEFATGKCSRIRYPYMKIDEPKLATSAPVSAVCMIENNSINSALRSIENPQHTEWQKNRTLDNPEENKKVKQILKSLTEEMNSFITDLIGKSESDSTDFEGASEYLPDEEDGMNNDDGNDTPSPEDALIISTPQRKLNHVSGSKKETNNNGDQDTIHATGDIDENGDTIGSPSSKPSNNPKPKPGPNPDPNPDPDDLDIYGPGFNPYLKQILSKNIKFRCMKPSDDDAYNISFSATTTENDCEINLSSIGDSNDTEKIEINSATINGQKVEVKHGRIVHFPIKEGERYDIQCNINRDDMFASKVEIYAYKK